MVVSRGLPGAPLPLLPGRRWLKCDSRLEAKQLKDQFLGSFSCALNDLKLGHYRPLLGQDGGPLVVSCEQHNTASLHS